MNEFPEWGSISKPDRPAKPKPKIVALFPIKIGENEYTFTQDQFHPDRWKNVFKRENSIQLVENAENGEDLYD